MRGRDLTEMPADTAAVGQQVLAEDDRYRVIGDHLADLLNDAVFAELYEPIGREAVWPSLLAMVTLFQFVEKVPDREAARMVVTRIDWKYALHLPLGYLGFDFSILCDFRQRLLDHRKEAVIFDTVLQQVAALGFIKKRGKQRTDSIAVLGAVRALSELEVVTETMRTALRAMVKVDADWVAKVVPAVFTDAYLDSRPDYRLSAAEREAALRQVGQDGGWLLAQIEGSASTALRKLAEVGTLQTVWAQRYHQVDGKVEWRTQTVNAQALVVSPHDVGVRIGQKRGKVWIGEKLHVSETAEAGEANFLTDVTTANASSGDAEALPGIREQLAEREVTPGEQYTDASYISGKQLAESEAAGITLLGPPLGDHSPNEFKIADFTLDREAKVATCPGGHQSVKWCAHTERDGSAGVNIHFDAKDCAACPLRPRCTTAQGGRCIHVSEHYEIVQARRAEAQTEAFREKMRARPAIEATLSELVRAHGLRRHRFRGEAKRRLQNLLKGAACNLKRLVRALLARWGRATRVGRTGRRALAAVASS